MPIVVAGGVQFDVDAVAFDKDGTLIDLHATWGPLARAWLHGVAVAQPGGPDPTVVRTALAEHLGYDLALDVLIADGTMSAGTLEQIQASTVDVLRAHGVEGASLRAALDSGIAAVTAVGPADPVPLADLAALFVSLHAARVHCAIVTSDNRSSALDLVDRLGIGHLVATIVGGDDAHAPKPAPDALYAVADAVGVDVARILMVGDSTTDQGAARAAGCPFVAVGRTGVASLDCDAVIDHVGQLTVTAPL